MIYILMGPSGSGKTEAGEYLKTKGIRELVSHTTRCPRPGEKDGMAYHFVDDRTFDAWDLVEESVYAGARYGVSRKEVEEKTKEGDVFAVTDLSGARAFRKLYGDNVRILYFHATPGTLRKRLKKRGEPDHVIRKRFINYIKNRENFNRFLSNLIIDNNYSKISLRKSLDYAIKAVKHRKID